MGGVIIIAGIIIPTLLFAKLDNIYIQLMLIATVWLGVIGFIDDYLKLKGNKNGMKALAKFIFQLGIAFGAMNYLFYASVQPISTEVLIPFTNNIMWDIGWMFLPFAMLVIVLTNRITITVTRNN